MGPSKTTSQATLRLIHNIILVEDEGGKLHVVEIKWTKARNKASKAWWDAYPGSTWNVITNENYLFALTIFAWLHR